MGSGVDYFKRVNQSCGWTPAVPGPPAAGRCPAPPAQQTRSGSTNSSPPGRGRDGTLSSLAPSPSSGLCPPGRCRAPCVPAAPWANCSCQDSQPRVSGSLDFYIGLTSHISTSKYVLTCIVLLLGVRGGGGLVGVVPPPPRPAGRPADI